ncbi:MAG: helix-turn-helix transcriptional regulator [Pedobacter sp.]|nr:helix-turn-helix transcriptional regulator [Pedobacter sp.]
MEIHMGRLLEKVIRKKGLNISKLANAIGVDQRSMYNWFAEPELEAGVLEKIAEAIEYDFTADLPTAIIKDPELIASDAEIRDDEYWKNKYINLLERYSGLLRQQQD